MSTKGCVKVCYLAIVRIQSTLGRYRNEAVFAGTFFYSKIKAYKATAPQTAFSNGEFIAMIADKLRLEQMSA